MRAVAGTGELYGRAPRRVPPGRTRPDAGGIGAACREWRPRSGRPPAAEGGRLPEFDRPVLGAAGQGPAVRAEGEGGDPLVVALEHGAALAGVGVPQGDLPGPQGHAVAPP